MPTGLSREIDSRVVRSVPSTCIFNEPDINLVPDSSVSCCESLFGPTMISLEGRLGQPSQSSRRRRESQSILKERNGTVSIQSIYSFRCYVGADRDCCISFPTFFARPLVSKYHTDLTDICDQEGRLRRKLRFRRSSSPPKQGAETGQGWRGKVSFRVHCECRFMAEFVEPEVQVIHMRKDRISS